MDIRIPFLNAFKLRITGNVTSGTHTETADMNVVRNLIVNFVRRGRIFQAHGIDMQGRIVILNLGTLPSGTYGVELVGYYNGEPWRFFKKDVFEIVRQNSDATPAGSGDVPTYDVTFELNFGGESVSPEYVEAAIAAHDADEQAHADIREALQTLEAELRQEIAEAGEVNDVQIDGQSILDPETKVANIDSSQFGKVDDVKVNNISVLNTQTKEANINITASVVANDTPGNPSASATMQDGNVNIEFANVKGERGNGIASVTEELSGQDGGTNTHTIHYTDPNVPDGVFHTRNGRQGIQGDSAIWDENEPHEKLTDLAHDLGDSTVKPMSQKGVTEAITPIQKLIKNDINVPWTDGKYMHPATPSTLKSNADTQTSSPIPVDVGDRVMLGTYELPSNTFAAIAYLETSSQASDWVKKAGVNSYGSEKFHNLEWIAEEAGYVVVSGVKNGMTLQIIPPNAVARQDDVLRQGAEINDIKAKLIGKFDDWDWNVGSLHSSSGNIVAGNTWQRYSDFVTLNKGDKVIVKTYYKTGTGGTYTIIGNSEGRLAWTTSSDTRGTYITKEYTAQSDNENIRVCVWVGDGTEDHPTMADWEATIEKADAVVTKAEFDKALGDSASLPDYWIDYLTSKMSDFSADADCFAFLSDTHSAENAGNSGEVLHWLAKNKGISKVIHGGDICCTGGPSTSFDNVPTNFEQMLVRDIKSYDRMAERASQYARFFGVKGNHDFFEYSGDSLGAQTPADVSRHIKGLMTDLGVRDNMQADQNSLYYYYDNSVAGIRYIFLDACHNSISFIQIGITQLTWLIATLNGTPNDYKVIVIGHSPASTYMAPSDETSQDKIGCVREMLIEANAKASGTYHYSHQSSGIGTEEGDVTYDFSDFNGEVIAYIHGHTHVDNQLYHDGIPFIGIVCDKADQHPYSPFCENTDMAVSNKPIGTAKEQAIDVATINNDKDVISMHRIGIGFDRHFHVGVVELNVGQTTTLSPSIITAVSYGGTDEDIAMSNNAWPYKHDYATINTSTGLVTAVVPGDVIAFAEDADHNKEFWHIKVTA